jgi:hypothetical protein
VVENTELTFAVSENRLIVEFTEYSSAARGFLVQGRALSASRLHLISQVSAFFSEGGLFSHFSLATLPSSPRMDLLRREDELPHALRPHGAKTEMNAGS